MGPAGGRHRPAGPRARAGARRDDRVSRTTAESAGRRARSRGRSGRARVRAVRRRSRRADRGRLAGGQARRGRPRRAQADGRGRLGPRGAVRTQRAARMSPSPSARSIALDVVRRVIEEGAYSNRTLPAALSRSGLEPRDRAFAMEITFGTLRRRLPLDAAIERAAGRPLDRMTPVARNALRIGAYQLLDADVAPHAAVSTTVDLVGGRERGFVNAVLRRIASTPAIDDPGADAAAVSARTGLARWAVDELSAVVGDEASEAAGALAARAPLSLRAIGGEPSVPAMLDELRAGGLEAEPGAVDAACVLLRGGDPRTIDAFRDGRVTVQDQASAFVTRLVGAGPGDHVYDVCAAPGGK